MLKFLNALVLYFYFEHVQRIRFCRCFLILNPAVFCVDDGVILWLKIKNPTRLLLHFTHLIVRSGYSYETVQIRTLFILLFSSGSLDRG